MRLSVVLGLSAVFAGGAVAAVAVINSRSNPGPQKPAVPEIFPCGSPKANDQGQPANVVILLDGVGSEESGGTYYPFAVKNPMPGVPTVLNYCPLNSQYEERSQPDLPSGLDSSLRRWSEFSVPGTSSGGSSSVPEATHACDRTEPATIPAPRPGPAPGSQTPSTATSVTVGTISGGFGKGTCLTEALANAGAVLLPYSYAGAVLKTSGQFSQQSYTAADSQQPLCSSVAYLAREITSMHAAWPQTRILVVGHSFGGLVAETWWFDEHPINGGHCVRPTGLSGVTHVFSLDSPINGVKYCEAAHQVLGSAASTWCDLWYGPNRNSPAGAEGVANDTQIAALDDHELSFTAVGTPNDPTYGEGLTGGGGGLRAQLVYRCANSSIFTDYTDPNAPCIDRTGGALPVSYPSASPECDASSGDIYGTTGHDIVKTCPAVIRLIVDELRLASSPARPASPARPINCGGGGAFVSINAQGLGCLEARRVANGWASGTNPTCGPDGRICHVVGFSCATTVRGNVTQLQCRNREQSVTARLGSY